MRRTELALFEGAVNLSTASGVRFEGRYPVNNSHARQAEVVTCEYSRRILPKGATYQRDDVATSTALIFSASRSNHRLQTHLL